MAEPHGVPTYEATPRVSRPLVAPPAASFLAIIVVLYFVVQNHMACQIGGPPPGLVVIVCTRAHTGGSLRDSPLFTSFLPSLSKSVSSKDVKALGGPACIYVCAEEDDEALITQAASFRRMVAGAARHFGVRLFFYPRRSSFRQTAAQAYADGALYLHHAHDSVQYSKAGWVAEAVATLQARHPRNIGFTMPAISSSSTPPAETERRTGGWAALGGQARAASHIAALVSRLHLDIFDELYPSAVPDYSVHEWLTRTYAALDGAAVVGDGCDASSSSRSGCPRAAGARKLQGWGALVECGRAAVIAFARHQLAVDPPSWRPVSCSAAASNQSAIRGRGAWGRRRDLVQDLVLPASN